MEKEKQEKLGKKLLFWSLGFLADQVAAIVLAIVLCINYTTFLGYFNIGNAWLKLADNARINNNYSESIEWYKKIETSTKKSFQKYKPYANLALAEIYSLELENKSYPDAFNYYKKAIEESKNNPDVRICYSALGFIASQIEKNNANSNEEIVALYNADSETDKTSLIDFAVTVLTILEQEKPDLFSPYSLSFPIAESEIKSIVGNETYITKTTTQWEYVSTIIDSDPGLDKVEKEEKIVYIEQWQELADTSSTACVSTNTYYKYYRYRANRKTEKLSFIDFINDITEKPIRIRLTDLKFDKDDNLIGVY